MLLEGTKIHFSHIVRWTDNITVSTFVFVSFVLTVPRGSYCLSSPSYVQLVRVWIPTRVQPVLLIIRVPTVIKVSSSVLHSLHFFFFSHLPVVSSPRRTDNLQLGVSKVFYIL